MIRRLKDRMYQDGLKELGLFNEEKGRLRGIFIAVLNYLKNCYREDKAKEVHRERIMATIQSCNFTAVSSGVLIGIIASSSALLFLFSGPPLINSQVWSVNSTQQDQKAVLIVKQRELPLPEPLVSPRAFRHIRVSFYPILQENATGHVPVPMFHDSQLSM